MPLSTGSFGPYEILAPIGAGGMGEVYRARDRRLGREVALKVLPAELSEDRDRLARFEQEARSASALNHPNIVTIHEIGKEDGTSYISMELVEGKTLRELVASGPLPIRRLLGIATQVAEGLAKAHGAGIVHRDLKPENVMVSKDGFVKILDFGLAKLIEPESGEVSAMPTVAKPETHPGVVMGTVAYMSPEQASGEPVDFRSDQFSLGSMLYEALAGEKPFQRKTAAETMSAIIREEPKPVASLRADVPAPLRWIVERCLAKDPDERYASTRDFARDLAGVRDHISEVASGEAAASTKALPRIRSRRAAAFASMVLILLIGAVSGWLIATTRKGPKTAAPTFRRLTFRTGALNNARFTPDGQTIVYGATWAGEKQALFSVRPESPESRSFEIEADVLAVSSSGEMAVLLNLNPLFGILARVPFAGGIPRPAVEGVPYASADWSPDGKELALVRMVEGRYRLEFPLGRVLYEGSFLQGPRFDSDGKNIAFFQTGKTGSVMVIRRTGEGAKEIASGFDLPGGAPCWTPDGKEVWFSGTPEPGRPSGLYAADLGGRVRLVAQMPGELELDDISRDGRVLIAHHTLMGTMRVLAPGESAERDLTWLDYAVPADLSPDGKTVLFTETGEGGGKASSVYLRTIDGSSPPVRLGEGQALAFAPDGKSVLVRYPGSADRFGVLPTAAGEPKPIALTGFESLSAAAWLPDGKEFIFDGKETGKGWRVYKQGLSGGRPRPISPDGVGIPSFVSGPVTPDGRWFFGARSPGQRFRFPIEGGEAVPIAGLGPDDLPVRWASDRSLWVRRGGSGEIWRQDIFTGRRMPAKKIDLSGGTVGVRLVMTPDGRSYVYGVRRAHSVLYVVEGLR